MGFVSLDDFHLRKLQPREASSVFVHDLKKLINQVILDMAKKAKEPLLLHQFLMGLPGSSGDIKTLDAAVTRARLLMTIDAEPVAMVEEKSNEVQLLTEQVALVTEQVAALSTCHQGNKQSGSGRQPRCFSCNKVGHVKHNCPYRYQEVRCFIARNCQLQGNEWGVLGQGSRRIPLNKP